MAGNKGEKPSGGKKQKLAKGRASAKTLLGGKSQLGKQAPGVPPFKKPIDHGKNMKVLNRKK